MAAILEQSFFARDVCEVAIDLLGRHLRHGPVVVRITEVEAYGGPEDSASHARFGRTARNAPMWGPPGHAYVYVCYGLHAMLNVVTNADGEAAAVLVRSCEPVEGLDVIRARRRGKEGPVLLAGPGKVASALALDASFSGHPFYLPGGLTIEEGEPARDILVGARVGIDYAAPADREAPKRFAIATSAWVTKKRALRPL
jgi:DNA-3-methyladenine glycosylase